MDYKSLHSKLGSFPHIQRKLDLVWGTEFGRPYLFELLHPERIGRKGFPFDVLLAVQDLLELHDQTFPHFKPRDATWDFDTYRQR